MTLRDFLQNKTLSAVELVNYDGNQIINVYIGEACYGLNIDTTNLESGMTLEYRTDFVLNEDILSVADVVLDTNTINMI
jgi:hypothetical protein